MEQQQQQQLGDPTRWMVRVAGVRTVLLVIEVARCTDDGVTTDTYTFPMGTAPAVNMAQGLLDAVEELTP